MFKGAELSRFPPYMSSLISRRTLLQHLINGGIAAGLLPSPQMASQLAQKASDHPQVTYRDIAGEAGLNFRHDSASSSEKYLIECMGAGCAWIDYNNDGLLDIYLVQSSNTPAYTSARPMRSALYRNNGDGTFTDVTEKAGVGAQGLFGMGVTVGDYDNDGYADFLVTGWNGAILYHNNGDGSFSDVTARAGIVETGRFANSAGWFDYDNDGLLDLFICHYTPWTPENNMFCGEHRPGYRAYCHPDNYPPDKSRLLHNNGDGTFSDVTDKSGIGNAAGKALGVVLADFDNDGWMDIFVANDAWPNFLFLNNHDGTFRDATYSSGVGFSQDGAIESGMGTDAADFNHDGWLDIYVTHLAMELNRLYRNEGGGLFTEATYETGLGNQSQVYAGFGMKFLDYDNDGFTDIFVANGHIVDNIHLFSKEISYAEPKLMLRNIDGRQFRDVSQSLGPDFTAKRVSRGAAIGDFDNDGDLDILVSNNGGAPQLLRCDVERPNNWVAVDLIGTKTNRDGVGAKLKIIAGDLTQYSQRIGGTSYCSSHDKRLFFGLGKRSRVDLIEVKWPTGIVDRLKDLEPNQFLTVREGHGLVASAVPHENTRKAIAK